MAEQPIWLTERGASLLLDLHVQPGARRTAVIGVHADRLKISLAAPPRDGRANAQLFEFLASRLHLPISALALVTGANARHKRVAVHADISIDRVVAALGTPQ